MRRRDFVPVIVMFCALGAARPATAVTLRYAIVVGNNVGLDPSKGSLPSLRHAEREARELFGRLIECCNFDPRGDRTILLVRPKREDLIRAASEIRSRMSEDAAHYGDVETFFAFFFTGHGLDGRLLLADGAVSKEQLGGLFREINADLTLGVFDACFSGSLDPSSLLAKGLRPTPGINVFRELPEEVLNAEGSVWFVSSGREEPSYEDGKLGGVFTHFLIEALGTAEADGPGISLDRIWAYARAKTASYTAERNRPQHPERIVSRMREQASIFFSFPEPRDAELQLGAEVSGTFLLSYREGHLTERIVKEVGRRMHLAVYSGPASLTRVEGGRPLHRETLLFNRGSTVVLQSVSAAPPDASLGRAVQGLWVKGFGDQTLRADAIDAHGTLSLGPAYGQRLGPSGRLVPRHAMGAEVRYDRGPLVLEGQLAYVRGGEAFEAWGYRIHGFGVEARGGLAVDLGAVRLSGLLAVGGGPLVQVYLDGAVRGSGYFSTSAVLSAAYVVSDLIVIRAAIQTGPLWSRGAGIEAPGDWSFTLGGSLAAMLRVF